MTVSLKSWKVIPKRRWLGGFAALCVVGDQVLRKVCLNAQSRSGSRVGPVLSQDFAVVNAGGKHPSTRNHLRGSRAAGRFSF